MRLIDTIWQLMKRTAWAATLLMGMLLASLSGQGQARGQQAVPSTPVAAPTGQPAPLAPAKLEEALRMLLKADSIATLRSRQLGGGESKGLVLDQAVTKLGHDFYDQFYGTFEAPMGVVDYNIVIAERPARGNSALVVLTVNDAELLELPLPTRADQMEEIVAAAVETAQGFLQDALNTSRQLESGHRLPPEQY
jgi:curli production assembly/transport component CsgE